MAPVYDQADLSCGICRETFKNPKFLPCFHTFCQECLQAMVRAADDLTPLRCPTCRAEVTLPSGGVPALQANFYLLPLLNPQFCQRHPGWSLEFRCKDDNTALCVCCKLVDHDQHPVEDLGKALIHARDALSEDLQRLQQSAGALDVWLAQRAKSLNSFRSNVQAQKELVLKREELLVAMVRARSEELLQQLESSVTDRLSCHQQELVCAEEKRETLESLQQEVTQALADASAPTLLALCNVMRHGRGSEQQLGQPVTSDLQDTADRLLVYHHDGQLRDVITDFLGRLVLSSGRLQTVFRCGRDERDRQVHALCVCSNGYFIVAYGSREQGGKGWVAKFLPSGDGKEWEPQPVTGRVGLSGLDNGLVRVEGREFAAMNLCGQLLEPPLGRAEEGEADKAYDVYNKLRATCLLRVSSSGDCHVRSLHGGHNGPTTDSKIFDISAKDPIAMDASQTGELFAVLEKGRDHVTLYRRGNAEPFATYSGNGEAFEPFDVCFCPIGGKERLVIADRINDLLHVLDVSEGCALIGQIGRACPELTQPTALCPDKEGRLLIGCQDGNILTLTHP